MEMIAKIDLYIGLVVSDIVVGVPFFYGMQSRIKKAVTAAQKAKEDKYQQFLAGLNAAIEYIKTNPNTDAKLIAIVKEIATLAGISIAGI